MNSNEPGDTLFNAEAISGIFGRILGQMFDPRTTIEIFRCAIFCWYLNILIARQDDLVPSQ